SKGRSPRGSVPLASDGPGMGAWQRPTCSTSPSPPRSISIGLWRGSTTAHGRRRAPPVSPPSRLPTRSSPVRPPLEVLLRSSRPLRTATPAEWHPFHLFYTTEIILVVRVAGKFVRKYTLSSNALRFKRI